MRFILAIIIHHRVSLSFDFLSSPPAAGAAAAARSSSSTQKSIPCSCYFLLSSQPFIPFVAQGQFVSNDFWSPSSFSSEQNCPQSTRPPADFPSQMQPNQTLTCHWQGRSLTYANPPHPVAAKSLLLLQHPTKTHFLGPAVPTTPPHLIHSRATLRSVTISTGCSADSLTLYTPSLTLAPCLVLAASAANG